MFDKLEKEQAKIAKYLQIKKHQTKILPDLGDLEVGEGPTSSTLVPKALARTAGSGGGIGYIPIAISTRDNPRLHTSLATE